MSKPLSQSYYQQTASQIQTNNSSTINSSNQSYLLKSNSLSNFSSSYKIDDMKHEAIKKALPPLPNSSNMSNRQQTLTRGEKQPLKAFDEHRPLSRRPSQKYLASDYSSAATSRRPSITGLKHF